MPYPLEDVCPKCGSQSACFCEYEAGRCATCGLKDVDCTCMCSNGIECDHPYCPEHNEVEEPPSEWEKFVESILAEDLIAGVHGGRN